MTILKARVTIKGKRPLLFHSFSVDSIPLEKKELTGVPGNDPSEGKRSVLMTKQRQLYIDSSYVFGCLRDGGKQIKLGRGSLQSKLASTLIVSEETALLDRFVPTEDKLSTDNTEPVYLDVRSVKNPNTKGRNVRYRIAASSGWQTTFNIEWENTIISRDQMRAILESSGSFVGLGDGRTIGFGRFSIESFEIEEEKPVKKKRKKAA